MHRLFESKRLYFREFTPDDANDFYLLNNNPKVIKYTGDPAFKNVEEARAFLKNYTDYQVHKMGRWAVFIKSTNTFIGFAGLKKHVDFVDLGYRFKEEHWGNGYATEAGNACLIYAKEKLKLPEVIGRTDERNIASVKVLEKLGFVYSHRDVCNGLNNALIFRKKL